MSFLGLLGVAGPLPQEAYVWQRAWNAPLQESVREHGREFTRIVVLAAEISLRTQPECASVRLDYESLRSLDRPIGLVLRIGPYRGSFTTNDVAARYLLSHARSVLSEAHARGLKVSELQMDFDCAESKLDGYRIWAQMVRSVIAPVPLTITALPSWLKSPSFKNLATATDGYVLQVHSLERPTLTNQFTLCDPVLARKAVEQAGPCGVPFRVALPTYGYLVAFSKSGPFLGLSAEGPVKNWPVDAQVREVRSNPIEMAHLLEQWTSKHPTNMTGIIWYRLPIKTDILNWRWPTLGAIVASRLPRESYRAAARRVEPGLSEISLVNNGELDISSRLVIEARWSREGGTRLLAGDALGAFELVDAGSSAAKFTTAKSCRVPAGESLVIGWLRLSEDREVSVECKIVQGGSSP